MTHLTSVSESANIIMFKEHQIWKPCFITVQLVGRVYTETTLLLIYFLLFSSSFVFI